MVTAYIKKGLLIKAQEYKLRTKHCLPKDEDLPLLIQEVAADGQ